ncbi:MAG: preprotein translocase subunit SecE [Gammaproteobacteria bacterium]|jgi:preprotein translocase subunit SecE
MTKHLIKNLNRNRSSDSVVPKKKFNVVFWIVALLLGVFAIINQQYVVYRSILLQFLVTVIFGIIAIFLLIRKTQQGLKFSQYWQESVGELKKVSWPSKKETMQTTGAVIIMVVIMGLVLWTVDSILIRLVAWLLRRGY